MKKILIAGISALSILAANGVYAQNTSTGAYGAKAGTTGAASGAIAGSQSLSGAASLGNQIGSIGDQNQSYSKSEAEPAIAPNLAGLYASPMACMGTSTASVGIGGVFSAGAGSTYQDDECNKREAVKLAAQLGLKGAAAAVFYDIEVVRNVVGTAINADEVARVEAANLAGLRIADTVPSRTTNVGNVRTTSIQPGNNNRPYWCATANETNARWNECQ